MTNWLVLTQITWV